MLALTLVVSNHDVPATGAVETAFSTPCCGAVMDSSAPNPVGIYLLAETNDNADQNGEKNEKDLEADPAGGVDRIWNSAQLA